MRIQFEAGNGINFLKGEDDHISIYAEIEVPENASDDYGYLTMKNAILAELTDEEKRTICFWYDGQEQFLAIDAAYGGCVSVDIERTVCGGCVSVDI